MAPHSEKDRFCRVGVTFADLLMGNIHLTSQMWLNAAREKKLLSVTRHLTRGAVSPHRTYTTCRDLTLLRCLNLCRH